VAKGDIRTHLELGIELGGVGSKGNVLLDGSHLATGADSGVVCLDDGAVAHQGGVGRESGQLGGGVGGLGLEGIDLGLVVLEHGCELSVVGGQLGLLGQGGVGRTLLLDAGDLLGAVLAALGGDGGGEEERNEDVGDLHLGGGLDEK
jgi:hypothetical protein